MNIILFISVFIIILFLYIHIYFHISTSNDLELYEIEKPSKHKLEEICDLKQPVSFQWKKKNILDNFKSDKLIEKYEPFDVYLRNLNYLFSNESGENTIEETDSDNHKQYVSIPLSFKDSLDFMNKVEKKNYISENNSDFLRETSIIKYLKYNDQFLRPFLMASSEYDMIFGTESCFTPLRKNVSFRNYFYVTEGNCKIKLYPPSCEKYIHLHNDYLNFEFRSLVNVWDIQEEYSKDMKKIHGLELSLKEGDVLFIPAHWYYSIYCESFSIITNFKYYTYMNIISQTPKYLVSFLQNTNIKKEIVKTKNQMSNITKV